MLVKICVKTLDVVQYWWYYNDTEKIKANTKGKVKQGFYSKRRKPSSNLKDVNPVWYPRKRWVQWYQKRHLTSSRDSPRRCDRNDQGDSWKNERVPIPQFEPPEKRDRLLSKGNNNGNFGEAILVNLTIRTWHTKTVKRIPDIWCAGEQNEVSYDTCRMLHQPMGILMSICSIDIPHRNEMISKSE